MLIKLLKHHTHAGRDYPPGSALDLRTSEAEWLIALAVAEPSSVADKPVSPPISQQPSRRTTEK